MGIAKLKVSEGWGQAGDLLLDDGGQLCSKVLAVEPFLKEDICSVPYIVPVKTEVKVTTLHRGSFGAAWSRMGSAYGLFTVLSEAMIQWGHTA